MNSPTAAAVIHWLARVAAVALAALFALFLFGEGPPRLPAEPLHVQLNFAGWAAIFLGYGIGSFRPVAGGALSLLALAGMNAVEWVANDRLVGPWFLLWAVPGVLYLIGGGLKRLPPKRNRAAASGAT